MSKKTKKKVRSIAEFAVVDLFAGPGGLAEGFSSVSDCNGNHPFQIALSVEKEKSAHATLLLRTFLRRFGGKFPDEYYTFLKQGKAEPDWASLYPRQWESASRDALQLELGSPDAAVVLNQKIDEIRGAYGDKTVLIGGPPCQAYSLVGRARNRGNALYVAAEDPKHFLYQNYIEILTRLRPAVFVMENVKGMLSSSIDNDPIFERVLSDLRVAGGPGGYILMALAPRGREQSELLPLGPNPADFIIRSEDFGLPQARHRVIVVGVRQDMFSTLGEIKTDRLFPQCSSVAKVRDVLDGMPQLRSGLSRKDSSSDWQDALTEAAALVCRAAQFLPSDQRRKFCERVNECARNAEASASLPRNESRPAGVGAGCSRKLRRWLLDSRLGVLANNETRGHMPSDLARYLFAAVYAEQMGESPKADQFPDLLAPKHKNWKSGKFADRFRVQLFDHPSTTVTCHISKDGHYFIHPDPKQCRSLTVREAARLQTFPDNYYFKGNRTEQFVQVGNAVPPFLAKQIGDAILRLLTSSLEAVKSRHLPVPRSSKKSLPYHVSPE